MKESAMSDNYILLKDAAEKIGCRYHALYQKAVKRKTVKGVMRKGRKTYLPKAEVERLRKIRELLAEI